MRQSFKIAVLAALLTCSEAYAANEKSFLFETFDGITELSTVLCMDQTDDGTIWFGTDKHLCSFDGYEVKSYTKGLGHKRINDIRHKGDLLYLGCNEGLYAFDTGTLQFVTFVDSGIKAATSLAMHGDYLYIASGDGTLRYNVNSPAQGSSITHLRDGWASPFHADGDTLWVCTAHAMIAYDCISGEYFEKPFSASLGAGGIERGGICAKGGDRIMWAGTGDSLLKVDLKTMAVNKVVSGLHSVNCMMRDGDNGLYIGTDSGLLYYTFADNTAEVINRSPVNCCFKDKDSNIWFGSDNGLLMLKRGIGVLDTDSFPENSIFSCMHKDSKGRLWIAGTQGLALYKSGKNGTYSFVRRYAADDPANRIPNNRIWSITEKPDDGVLYIASDGGFLRFDEQTERFELTSIEGAQNWIYDIIADSDKVLIAAFNGVYRLDEGDFRPLCTTAEGLSRNDICQITEDKAGRIWILTWGHTLYTLDPGSRTVRPYVFPDTELSNFPDCILSDENGDIWISVGNKIIRQPVFSESKEADIISLVSSADEFDIFSMADILGHICVCTGKGIFVIDKSEFTIKSFNPRKQCVCVSYDRASGNILLGALGQVSYIKATDLEDLLYGDRVGIAVTSVTASGRRIDKEDVENRSIVLPFQENSVSVSISDFSFSHDVTRKFKAFAEGKRFKWSCIIDNNSFTVPDLKPGRYNVYVTSGDIPGGDDKVLSIRVRHHWLSSIPMLILYFLILAALVMWTNRWFGLKHRLELEKQRKEELIRSAKEKESFYEEIAHEIKTPLSLVVAPLSKLLGSTTDKDSKRLLQLAYDNSNKLSSLVHSVIEFYRDSKGNVEELICGKVNFVDFAESIFDAYKDNYPHLKFTFNCKEESIIADIDAAKMEIALNNLLSNACKYNRKGGSVALTIEHIAAVGRIVIKVSDTGIGIPEDELPMVFDRYYESSRTKNLNCDSTGVGLSICKKYIEAHQGRISVESSTGGTTFTAVIPSVLQSETSESPVPAVEAATSEEKPLVVIVDDNSQICSFLEDALSDRFRCLTAGNGKRGLKLCMDSMPDLIITDEMMPVMSGLEMCRQIREFPPLSTTPVIMLTAKGDKSTERKSIELNIDAFVQKPFDLDMLRSKIGQLIGNKQRIEQKIRMEMISAPKEDNRISYDERILKHITEVIEENIEDPNFTVSTLCEMERSSEKQMYRKVKQLTGLSTVEYIRSIRMKKAALMMQSGRFTVSEVMYAVGFNNASYFTRAFSAYFKVTPSEYLKSYKKKQ